MTTKPCRTPDCTRPAWRNWAICTRCRYRNTHQDKPTYGQRSQLDPLNVEIAVARRAFPEGLTNRERRLTGQRLAALGLTTTHIAALAHVSTRTVERWRAAARIN